jgi:dGTPase
VYRNQLVHNEFEKAQKIIRDLYMFFLEHEFPNGAEEDFPERVPVDTPEQKTQLHRHVCDFIAGMTDPYALELYTQIFMPKPWPVL